MKQSSNVKTYLFIGSFVGVFLLLYPVHTSCISNNCLLDAVLAAFIFSFSKLGEYDFFKGSSFNGFYGFMPEVKSIAEDSSKENIFKRRFWFSTLIIMDGIIIFIVIEQSWLLN